MSRLRRPLLVPDFAVLTCFSPIGHLEGGIIDRILVQDGSEVKVGDPLILLEDTMARASYQLIRTQYYTRAAQQARLIASISAVS